MLTKTLLVQKSMIRKFWVETFFGHGQMSPGQMFPGQMSPLQLEFAQEGPSNLSLKFGKIRPVTAEMLPTLSSRWVVGVPSHFRVKPKLRLG